MSKPRIAVAGAGYIGLAHMAVTQASQTCDSEATVLIRNLDGDALSGAGGQGFQRQRDVDRLFRGSALPLIAAVDDKIAEGLGFC